MRSLRSSLIPALSGAFLIASGAVGAGQIYKWVDPSGGIHYGDQPQPGWKPVDVNPLPAGDAAAPVASGESGDEGAAAAERRAAECQRRKEQLASYRNASNIVERDSLGNERQYNEEDRLKLIEMTERQVRELCGEEGE